MPQAAPIMPGQFEHQGLEMVSQFDLAMLASDLGEQAVIDLVTKLLSREARDDDDFIGDVMHSYGLMDRYGDDDQLRKEQSNGKKS